MSIKYREQKGSALIITMIIVGTVASLIFSVGQLTIRELKQVTALEDSLVAYHSAEAGIEEGLVAWRFNRNVELSFEHKGDLTKSPTASTGTPVRIDLKSAAVAQTASASNLGVGKNPQVDLKIWYKTDKISGLALLKDQSVEYDVSGASGGNLSLVWSKSSPTLIYTLEYTLTKTELSGAITLLKKEIITDQSRSFATISLPSVSAGERLAFRLKTFVTDPAGGTVPDTAALNYAITPSLGLVDSGATTVEATGYYGSTKRKLQVKIDRTSGTIGGLYDFVLFNLTTP